MAWAVVRTRALASYAFCKAIILDISLSRLTPVSDDDWLCSVV